MDKEHGTFVASSFRYGTLKIFSLDLPINSVLDLL